MGGDEDRGDTKTGVARDALPRVTGHGGRALAAA